MHLIELGFTLDICPGMGLLNHMTTLINLLFLSLSLSLVFHNLSISVKSTFKFGEYRGQISLKTFFKLCLFTVNLFFLSKMYLCCPFLFKALFL